MSLADLHGVANRAALRISRLLQDLDDAQEEYRQAHSAVVSYGAYREQMYADRAQDIKAKEGL